MSRRKNIPVEKKVKIVRSYIRKEIGLMEASKQGCVDYDTMVSWVRNYEAEGIEAFLHHGHKVYSPEMKRSAVKAYLEGEGSLFMMEEYLPFRASAKNFQTERSLFQICFCAIGKT